MNEWPFKEDRNLAVIASKNVILGSDWIAYVFHDEDDGGWQFLDSNDDERDEKSAVIVSLESVYNIDPTISELANLPLGWGAFRLEKGQNWERRKIE